MEQFALMFANLVNKGQEIGGVTGGVLQVVGYAGGIPTSIFTPEVFTSGGIPIVINELTFGLTDKLDLTNSDQYQDIEHQISRALAVVSRELLIAAATGGVAKAAQAEVRWAQKAVRAQRLMETGLGGVAIGQGIKDLSDGDGFGWIRIASGVFGIAGSFQGMKVIALPRGRQKLKLGPLYHNVQWPRAREVRNATLITKKGKRFLKGECAKNYWTWEHLFVTQKLMKKYPFLQGFGNSYLNTFLRLTVSTNSKWKTTYKRKALQAFVLAGLPTLGFLSYKGASAVMDSTTVQDFTAKLWKKWID